MFRQSASRHSTRAAHLRLALCPSPKAALSPGTLPSVQVSAIHPLTSQSGTLVVPFSLRHYHRTWQSFPRRPLLVGTCQGPLMVFPASHHSLHGEDPHVIQLHHWNRGFVTPCVPVGRHCWNTSGILVCKCGMSPLFYLLSLYYFRSIPKLYGRTHVVSD